jgi:hypothetical protein
MYIASPNQQHDTYKQATACAEHILCCVHQPSREFVVSPAQLGCSCTGMGVTANVCARLDKAGYCSCWHDCWNEVHPPSFRREAGMELMLNQGY